MNGKGFWLAFSLGVVAGSSVALLYAPHAGAKTRRKLRVGFADANGYLGDTGSYLRVQASRMSQEAQATLQRTKDQMDDAVDTFAGMASTAMRQTRSLV